MKISVVAFYLVACTSFFSTSAPAQNLEGLLRGAADAIEKSDPKKKKKEAEKGEDEAVLKAAEEGK